MFSGLVGTIAAAVIGLVGLFVGNSGVASPYLPGTPTATQTVPGPTVTAPGPTVTVRGPTVTESERTATVDPTSGSVPSDSAVIHLADPSTRPDDVLVDRNLNDEQSIGIDGKEYDFGVECFVERSRPTFHNDRNQHQSILCPVRSQDWSS